MMAIALLAGAALAAVMALAWAVQQRIGSSRYVDAFWSLGTGLVAAAAALLPFDGVMWRQIAVACCVLLWALRLGGHLEQRNRALADDPRYRKLQLEWGAAAPRRMFLFLQGQAAIGLILVMAVALAAHATSAALRLQDVAGVAIFLTGVTGEAVADRQLRAFSRAHRGAVCDLGLWRWSRHPNYFFEWLTWCAYPVIALDAGWGVLALAAPAAMYWALVHASGIPPLEEHMLTTRGDAYRRYQAQTSAFFPLPPRR